MDDRPGAFATAAHGAAAGLDIRVAANLSARLLQDTAFPERLRVLLAWAQAAASSLELEITESAMMLIRRVRSASSRRSTAWAS